MKQPETMRAVNLTLAAAGLLVIATTLVALLIVTTRAAAGSSGHIRLYLFRLAWLSAALLAMCLLMLAWVLVRYVQRRMRPPPDRSQTPYVDAWAEAGKRLKLDDDQEAPGRNDEQSTT